jgi:DNA-directed RNA polymerase subunit H (RpoH/RPB5)
MSKLITELYKSRNILLEQLNLQGYDTKDYVGCGMAEINIMFDKNIMDMLLIKKDTNEKIYIKYLCSDAKQITAKKYNSVVDELFRDNSDDFNDGADDEAVNEKIKPILEPRDALMIISMQEINDSLTRHVKENWEMYGYYVTIVNLTRLQYNILNHDLVPPHTVIRDTIRLEEIKKKYYIEGDDKFPTISRFDPTAICIGLRPGELVEILRPSKTAITTLYYRIGVNI